MYRYEVYANISIYVCYIYVCSFKRNNNINIKYNNKIKEDPFPHHPAWEIEPQEYLWSPLCAPIQEGTATVPPPLPNGSCLNLV